MREFKDAISGDNEDEPREQRETLPGPPE
jgi:hypothetical protein